MKRQQPFKAPRKTQPAAKKAKTSQAVVSYNVGRTHPQQPRAELKAFDVVFAATVFANAATFIPLNTMVLGTEFFNRVGRKTYAKSLRIQGDV